MIIIMQEGDFRIEFNGSSTYFITDNLGEVWDAKGTESKAINSLKRIMSNYNA